MNYFSLSFGKDSMATLLLAIEKNIKIDKVFYCEIMFDNDISGEHPIMADWIPKAEKILKDKFDITVEHIKSKVTFKEQFFKVKKRGNHIGDIYGFPYVVGAWCNSYLKLNAINKYLNQFKNSNITQFLGIAYDEPNRWKRKLNSQTDNLKYRSLLFENKIIEYDTFAICKKYGLLSPVYSFDNIFRGGCWFCPKQCIADLYSLWLNYPQYFNILLDMEQYSSNTFKPNTTLSELDKKFKNGFVPKRKKIPIKI